MTQATIARLSFTLPFAHLVFVAGCATGDLETPSVHADAPALELAHDCDAPVTTATLRDAAGTVVGRVEFSSEGETTVVSISAHLPDAGGSIHGIHIHANDNPDNGEGCVADPAQPASTHFVSADGHYNPGAGTHGHHAGDMPALSFTHAGEASLRFITDQFHSEEVIGRAVILHAGPDNYGNVPVGSEPNQYTPNSTAATELTAGTGNAGARSACGVIE